MVIKTGGDDDDRKMASLSPGSVVIITGLQNRPELNGHFGVVKRYHSDCERFEVIPARGKGTLALKRLNLTQDGIITPSDPGFRERRHTAVAFWPKVGRTIPVQALEGFPRHWTEHGAYLTHAFDWEDPKCLGGVTSQGNAKPNFLMLFDGADNVSPLNSVAQDIADLLPDFELNKVRVARERKPFRGVCVLVYSPMKTMTFSSGGFAPGVVPPDGTELTSGNANRTFSLQQLLEVLRFHQSPEGRAQYRAHDDPMHRMFGDLSP